MGSHVKSRAFTAALTFLLSAWTLSSAAAQEAPEGRGDTVFFGLNVGMGAAQISQPGFSRDFRPGLQYDAVCGFGLTRHWAAGLELSTWQPFNIDGNPSHLHLFAWRLEYTFGPQDGLVAATSLGLGLGDGSQSKRIGSGGVLQLGWRWPIARLVTLTAEAGAHGVAFTDGTVFSPFVALQLRFYGRSGL